MAKSRQPKIRRDVHLAYLAERANIQNTTGQTRVKQVELLGHLKQIHKQQKQLAFEEYVAEQQLLLLDTYQNDSQQGRPILVTRGRNHINDTHQNDLQQGRQIVVARGRTQLPLRYSRPQKRMSETVPSRQRIPLPDPKRNGKYHYITEFSERTLRPVSPGVKRSSDDAPMHAPAGLYSPRSLRSSIQPYTLERLRSGDTPREPITPQSDTVTLRHSRSGRPGSRVSGVHSESYVIRRSKSPARRRPHSHDGRYIPSANVEKVEKTRKEVREVHPHDLGSKLAQKLKTLVVVTQEKPKPTEDVIYDPNVTLMRMKQMRSPKHTPLRQSPTNTANMLRRTASLDSFYEDKQEESEIERIWKSPMKQYSGSTMDLPV